MSVRAVGWLQSSLGVDIGGEWAHTLLLNVGGMLYVTTRHSLRGYRDHPIFGPILQGRARKGDDGSFIVDRDGNTFRYVLNYLRSGTLCLPESFDDWEQLLEDIRYYQLPELEEQLMERFEYQRYQFRKTLPQAVFVYWPPHIPPPTLATSPAMTRGAAGAGAHDGAAMAPSSSSSGPASTQQGNGRGGPPGPGASPPATPQRETTFSVPGSATRAAGATPQAVKQTATGSPAASPVTLVSTSAEGGEIVVVVPGDTNGQTAPTSSPAARPRDGLNSTAEKPVEAAEYQPQHVRSPVSSSHLYPPRQSGLSVVVAPPLPSLRVSEDGNVVFFQDEPLYTVDQLVTVLLAAYGYVIQHFSEKEGKVFLSLPTPL